MTILIAIVVILSTLFNWKAEIAAQEISKCNYLDTVDLTGSTKFANGSYLYENVVIPAELTGEYDYEILFNEERIPVAKHVRGCACQLKPCIRFCCHPKQILVPYARECTKDFNEPLVYNPYVNVTLGDGSVIQKHVLDEFLVQLLPVPCALHYALDPEIDEYDNYELFENGTVFRMADKAVLSKADYCIQPVKVGESHKLLLHNCHIENDLPWDARLTAYVMVTSVVCLLLTIATNLALKKLQNLHSKCFTMYLICLAVGYSMIVMDLLGVSSSGYEFCIAAGYIGYFAIMAAFLWLTFISLDLWNTFSRNFYTNPSMRKNHFLFWNVCTWSIASILLIIVYICDYFAKEGTDSNWIPGIGYYSCWIKTQDWSAMIYFFGPMLLAIIFNSTTFIITITQIFRQNKMNRRDLKSINSDRQLRLNSDRNQANYRFFLRIFTVMGVSWSFEILNYLTANNNIFKKILLFSDMLNASQGILVFALTVLNGPILKQLRNKIGGKEKLSDTSFHQQRSKSTETQTQIIEPNEA